MSHTLFSPERLVILPEINSTNTWARHVLKPCPPLGYVVWALHQTEGRGQKGTRWESEPGQNLTCSLVIHPFFLKASEAFYLSKVASLAVYHALAAWIDPSELFIKWPNDLLVSGKKIAGILIETQVLGESLNHAIVGIGVNVNQETFPVALKDRATSLRRVTQSEVDLKGFLWSILSHFEQWYSPLTAKKWETIDAAYYQYLWGYRQYCNFEVGGQSFSARVEGVEPGGRLLLRDAKGLRSWDIKEIVWKDIGKPR